jgi:uncharacterized protein YbaR (Trm112 family)
MPGVAESPAPIDPDLLKILVCPATRSPLVQRGAALVGTAGGLTYPIRNGIPLLLAEEASLPAGVASLAEFRAKFTPRDGS